MAPTATEQSTGRKDLGLSPVVVPVPAAHTPRRFRELDGLRGLAAIWVVVFHYTAGVGVWLKGSPFTPGQLSPLRFNIEGLAAVDLFFMISGFVIFMSVEAAPSVWDFGAARFARLYPVIWVCVSLTAATAVLIPFPMQPVTLLEYAANMTMLQIYLHIQSFESVYWSLGYELGFYALMATLLASRQLHRIELIGCGWVGVSILAYQIFPSLGGHIPYRVQSLLALDKAELFLAGIVFFRIHKKGLTWQRIGLLVLCYSGYVAGHYEPFKSLLTIFFIVFALAINDCARWLCWRPLTYLGAISFPLYMIHASVGIRLQILLASMAVPPWAILPIAVAIVILIAHLIHSVAEVPGQRLLHLWWRRLSPRVQQPG